MNWFKFSKAQPGEIRSLQLQVDMLKDKKQFIPKQITQLRNELDDITRQILSLEKQLNYLRSK